MSHTTQAIIILIGTTILVTTMIIIAETYSVNKKPNSGCHIKQRATQKIAPFIVVILTRISQN